MGHTMGLPHSSVSWVSQGSRVRGMHTVGGMWFSGMIFTLDKREAGVRVRKKGEAVRSLRWLAFLE